MTSARLLCWGLFWSLVALPPMAQGKKDEGEVSYDVAVERVEIDVLVLDKDGKFVTGLEGKDFEVSEEGKPVVILDFEERDLAPAAAPRQAAPAAPADVPVGPAPQPRRFIIFVDLLNTGLSASQALKPVLMRFVNETLGKTDQVMIAVLTRDGRTMVLQGFTGSRPEMVRAITALRGNPRLDVKDRSQETEVHEILYGPGVARGGQGSESVELGLLLSAIQTAHGLVKNNASEENRRSILALDSVATLAEKIEEAGWQTGRKTVIYFSQGLPIRPGQEQIDIINRRIEEYNRLVEITASDESASLPRAFPVKVDADLRTTIKHTVGRLNRFGATLYTVDARGSFRGASADPGRPQSNLSQGEQQALFFESQETLNALAVDTGGLPFYNRGNLTAALIEIEMDNRSRYFLSYQPPPHKKGKKAKFYEVKIKCKRPGVSVRARKGYLD